MYATSRTGGGSSRFWGGSPGQVKTDDGDRFLTRDQISGVGGGKALPQGQDQTLPPHTTSTFCL